MRRKAFNWYLITNATWDQYSFITGTIENDIGNIEITSE